MEGYEKLGYMALNVSDVAAAATSTRSRSGCS